jgi:hypothetical protein
MVPFDCAQDRLAYHERNGSANSVSYPFALRLVERLLRVFTPSISPDERPLPTYFWRCLIL